MWFLDCKLCFLLVKQPFLRFYFFIFMYYKKQPVLTFYFIFFSWIRSLLEFFIITVLMWFGAWSFALCAMDQTFTIEFEPNSETLDCVSGALVDVIGALTQVLSVGPFHIHFFKIMDNYFFSSLLDLQLLEYLNAYNGEIFPNFLLIFFFTLNPANLIYVFYSFGFFRFR